VLCIFGIGGDTVFCVKRGERMRRWPVLGVISTTMISVLGAARRIGCNPETIRRWVGSGQLASYKAGTQYLINEADLDSMLKVESVVRPAWLERTSTGEPMPDVVGFLRKQRVSHRSQ